MTDFWDKIAGVYDLAESINGDVYHEMCAQTERLVPAGAKVLDCAAGTGELSLAAAKNAESVVCTDLSEMPAARLDSSEPIISALKRAISSI